MKIHVLRLGHRLPRDERISTHVALVARAFGADEIFYSGQHDSGLEDSVARICERWGGSFSIKYEKNFRNVIKKHKKEGFQIVHLTMYGIPLPEALPKLGSKLLIIVGSEQVPREIYELSDNNVSVTNQPHSEVAALAIALDRLMKGKELENIDFGGKISIIPCEKGKNIKKR